MLGETTGAVRVLLRLEGFCVLVVACVAYSKFSLDWSTFAIYFLVPDISLLGYFAGAKVGAISYNTAHSYIGAIASLVIGFTLPSPALQCAGLIWCAHIGFDRALGYGLKYPEGFGFTHLGRIGRFGAKRSEKQ
ncbi:MULTISPECIES: DUF4260 domain-containing protein [Methylomonas]|uniref:DUF4260 domain-containing protein n=1 Tax=Methylomonas koyamae TaxID=702114 RepID=A0A177NBB7_9GAMM|nr:DUF4260 domain-containing protein [Methylomonas koyamae]OAI15338.1 hypothetical protein A1355_10615 [Methylomonas koyamae]